MSQPSQNTITPEEIINIALKHRWYLIVPFFIAIVTGICYAIISPKAYKASTTIMVQSQSVPDSYVQSVVSSDITSRLSTITQQVMSRTNIERIINDYSLFSDPDYDDMFLEDKVLNVRKNIDVQVNQSNSRGSSSSFTISFKGQDPEKVKNITNALATYFIDENLKVRESQATGTSDFLDDELETMRQRLENSEQSYREYRQKYMGELPEQLDANLNILDRLREELLDQQQALRETKNSMSSLEQQFSESRQHTAFSTNTAIGSSQNGETADLEQLQAQLEALQTRYTESHPSVVRLKNMINKVKESVDDPSVNSNNSGDSATNGGRMTVTTPQENQLANLRLQIQNMEAEIEDLKKQAAIYQKRIEDTPKREEELLSIQRDYDNLKDIYDSLLSRRLEAEISVNMEKKQKGEQFQIIDSARLPEKPVAPNMKKLFLATIVLGLGIGGGIVFLLEFLNKSFKRIEDVESIMGLPVLATISPILHPKDKLKNRINNIFSLASIVFSCILLAGFAALTLKGVDNTLEIVRRFVNI